MLFINYSIIILINVFKINIIFNFVEYMHVDIHNYGKVKSSIYI